MAGTGSTGEPPTRRQLRGALSTIGLSCLSAALAIGAVSAQPPASAVPTTWQDEAIGALEVPLANPVGSPRHVTAEYYYRIPVAPIYKTYSVYAPGREPA